VTPEHRAAIAAGERRAWANPEVRKRRSAAIQSAWDDPPLRSLMSARFQKDGSRSSSPEAYREYFRRYRKNRQGITDTARERSRRAGNDSDVSRKLRLSSATGGRLCWRTRPPALKKIPRRPRADLTRYNDV
jgi:hypothetical protein